MVTKASNGSATKHKAAKKVIPQGVIKVSRNPKTATKVKVKGKKGNNMGTKHLASSTNGTATTTKPKTPVVVKVKKTMPPLGQLNTPLARVLGVLCASKSVMSRAEVVAGVVATGVSCYQDRIPNETLTWTWLIEAGYATLTTVDVDVIYEGDPNRKGSRTVTGHRATPEGRAAYKAYTKAKEKAAK